MLLATEIRFKDSSSVFVQMISIVTGIEEKNVDLSIVSGFQAWFQANL